MLQNTFFIKIKLGRLHSSFFILVLTHFLHVHMLKIVYIVNSKCFLNSYTIFANIGNQRNPVTTVDSWEDNTNIQGSSYGVQCISTCWKVQTCCNLWESKKLWEVAHWCWMLTFDVTDIALPASNNGTCRDKLTTKMCLAYSYGQSEGPNSLLQ